MNPLNVKAWYRSATACLALDKFAEAEDACSRGLEVEPSNVPLKTLTEKVAKRKQHVEGLERQRREREERKRAEQQALKTALKSRNIPTRQTNNSPELEDAVIALADPLDPSSALSIPVLLLYPLALQSDFIKSFSESETLIDHLSYILPLPWDEGKKYQTNAVDCYLETASGGLIKAGKKLPLIKILSSGKIDLVDGLLKINVVPTIDAAQWIAEFKKRQPS